MIKINKKNFEELCITNKLPTLMFFSAEWCKPCSYVVPMLETISEKYKNKLNIVMIKITDDEIKDLGDKYQIRNLPTFLITIGGETHYVCVGSIREESLIEKLRPFVILGE